MDGEEPHHMDNEENVENISENIPENLDGVTPMEIRSEDSQNQNKAQVEEEEEETTPTTDRKKKENMDEITLL
jgi:hypothetical protein